MKIKIFESKHVEKDKNKTAIDKLIDNRLPLQDKMKQLRDSISQIKLTPNGDNELVKKLFEGIGGTVYLPRKGDNSERFDALISLGSYKSVVEIEIPSTAILDAPRNLLDDFAVLKTRKKELSNKIVPLVICWDLPNKRTDYWNVISDIKEVLNIEVKTISILALAVHYWTDTPLDLINDYYLDNTCSTISNLDDVLESHGTKPNDFPGYFSPFK